MEISIKVQKLGPLEGENPLLLTCAFTMVALNPATKRSVGKPLRAGRSKQEEASRSNGRFDQTRTLSDWGKGFCDVIGLQRFHL